MRHNAALILNVEFKASPGATSMQNTPVASTENTNGGEDCSSGTYDRTHPTTRERESRSLLQSKLNSGIQSETFAFLILTLLYWIYGDVMKNITNSCTSIKHVDPPSTHLDWSISQPQCRHSYLEKVMWLLITPLKSNKVRFQVTLLVTLSIRWGWMQLITAPDPPPISGQRFPLQDTMQPTSSTLPRSLVLHQSPAFIVWVVGDLLQKSRPWLCSQLSA